MYVLEKYYSQNLMHFFVEKQSWKIQLKTNDGILLSSYVTTDFEGGDTFGTADVK